MAHPRGTAAQQFLCIEQPDALRAPRGEGGAAIILLCLVVLAAIILL
jgi:hypothetical protein